MSIFEEVKRAVPMIEAYRKYDGRSIRKQGNRYMAYCSKHKEKSPSLIIYEGAGFYCFGCQWGGDVVKYAADIFGLTNLEACKKLADDFGINLSDEGIGRREIVEKNRHNEEKRRLAVALVAKLNKFYDKLIIRYKQYQQEERELEAAGRDYIDPYYRYVRQAFRFYDIASERFINGDFGQRVWQMQNFNNEYFFRLQRKAGDENARK